ncbi:MAG: Asp-tRNA(Asn)/Glu-tRNA(Gln) amidotransferase subunit GatB [Candidatus Aenigmarchaeota archaeon]|nr:Asp-tRNA(Asn)/Glu-tRNA(Gln) amidotransferase subunit GatB [Candidatus Aenigmarchaeota archaeon]
MYKNKNIRIGLETHVQLNTRTKLFCSCSTQNILKAEPNSRTCPICLGHPGSKPKVNRVAIEMGIRIALALGCKIAPKIFFSRKTYFYPDMSKNYQITQYEIPLAKDGKLETIDENGKRKIIKIERINLEEDPAKLQHVGGNISNADYTLIDYNRSGIPLCEIVTAPDFSTPKETRMFLKRLMAILEYLRVFIPEKFSIKTDANISINGGKRVEIKNITGFLDLEKALISEIFRQRCVIERGEEIVRETRAWVPETKTTVPLRKKEFEEDYGYIFEPDLTKIEINKDWISEIKEKLPELPHQKFERYQKEFNIRSELASAITSDLDLAQFYEKIIKEVEPKFAASWINVLIKTLHYNNITIKDTKLTKDLFVKLLKLIQSKKVTDLGGEMILRKIIFNPEKFEILIKEYSKIEDMNKLNKLIEDVLKEEERAINDYRAGNEKVIQFLVGQVIRKSSKRIDAKIAYEMIKKKLETL